MKDYYVRFVSAGGEECLVVLPSFFKLLLWFLRTARQCHYINIFVIKE